MKRPFMYIKEQTHKNKFKILASKNTILNPRKSVFLVFEEKPLPNFFSLLF